MTDCYCRRCLIHDDPGGCLVMEARWWAEHPDECLLADDECHGAVLDGLCRRHDFDEATWS